MVTGLSASGRCEDVHHGPPGSFTESGSFSHPPCGGPHCGGYYVRMGLASHRGSLKAQAESAAALFLMLFVVALFLPGCGRQPGLALEDIREVTFTNLNSGKYWPASETEVRALVEHYSDARNLSDDFGTTPPARIEILLKSGDALVVWGGGETYQTVREGDNQYNIESPGLHRMLQQIAAVGQP